MTMVMQKKVKFNQSEMAELIKLGFQRKYPDIKIDEDTFCVNFSHSTVTDGYGEMEYDVNYYAANISWTTNF